MKKLSELKVSVIMSVYNDMPFLKEAVKSILSQTYKNLEFIIVDDASVDDSWTYLKAVKDKRIKLIKNKKNLGLAVSLNKALKVATGYYVARMDADDISLAQRITTQIHFLQNNQSVDLCGTWVSLIDANNKKIGSIHYPKGDKEIKKTLRRISPLIHPTWLCKKSLFRILKGYDDKWDIVEDYDFLVRARKYTMANIGKELLMYRSQRNRRSIKAIQQMYTKSFLLRWHYFKKGRLDLQDMPYLLRSFISAYFFPPRLKIYLNKKAGLI